MVIIFNVFALALTAGLCSLPLSFDSQPPSEKLMPKQISDSDIFKFFGNDPFKMKIKRHLGKVGKCADGKIWILGMCKSPNFESGESGQDAETNYSPPADIKINTIATTGKPVPPTKPTSDSDLVPITGTITDKEPTSEPALDVVPLSKPEPTGAVTIDRSTHVTPPTKIVPAIDITSTTSASVVSIYDEATTTKTVPTTDGKSTTAAVPTIKVASTTEPDSDAVSSSDVVPEKRTQTPIIVQTTDVELNTDLTSTTVESISNTVPGTKRETLHDENKGNERGTESPETNKNYSGQTVDLVFFIAFFIIALLAFAYEKWLRSYVSTLCQRFRSERRNEDENQINDVVDWPLLTK